MRNLISYFVLLCVSFTGFLSCKKSITPIPRIALETPQISGALVNLKWSKVDDPTLEKYMVVKRTDSNQFSSAIYIDVDKNTLSYTDTLPLSPYVKYFIVAQLSAQNGQISSNDQKIYRSDIGFIFVYPKDALFDKETQIMDIYDNYGNIIAYDVRTKKQLALVNISAGFGYCALGNYNGVKELYVPQSDGKLTILNAATLQQIDQVSISTGLSSVAVAGDIMYLTNSWTSYLYAYRRSTKALVSSTSCESSMRIKSIPGTTTELLGLVYYNAYQYTFNGDGTYVSQQTASFPSASLNYNIFEVFPAGDRFITSSQGTIIKKDLSYARSLPYNGIDYTTFDFDNSAGEIYAGTSGRSIQVYAIDDIHLIRTIPTQGYPLKIFSDNGPIISISLTGMFGVGNIAVETVE